ncbi:MAG: transposase [Thermodesulfobacteriota bacterium]|nr:transposase [Thermodesulfobacteriota bacterium]
MTGPFVARETIGLCHECNLTFDSEALQNLVPKYCNVAYDLLVFVGQALFRRYRTVQEICGELIARNIHLSPSEIGYLGRKFITFLAAAHRRATPKIRQTMTMAGGYILHLDAAHDGDSPALMTGIDGLSQFVLANIKIPTEHADYIIPFLRKIEADYGVPLACVRDMGTGIGKAVATVFPDVHDFICHFHFLRDIGKDYLEPAYARLRKCLRSHGTSTRLHSLVRELRPLLAVQSDQTAVYTKAITNTEFLENSNSISLASIYSLVLWALQGKHCGDGYGFPFDRPLLGFADRLLELEQLMPELLKLFLDDDKPDKSQPVFKLLAEACFVAEDPDLREAVDELHWRCQVFDSLRTAMRIAPVGGGKGLNDEGSIIAMATIRQGVEKFRSSLDEDPDLITDHLSKKMAAQIDKYGDKLFADPITVQTPIGPSTIYPQRTNNILEQFFRKIRRGFRRKTGNNSMRRALQTMLADTPLVKNLDNSDYMKILLDGKENLEELFAEMGKSLADKNDALLTDTDRILPGFRPLASLSSLPGKLIQSLTGNLDAVKSN